ncbi:MAG: hypothetical protein EPN85_00075, partial [Bacteroidetes bacterium]
MRSKHEMKKFNKLQITGYSLQTMLICNLLPIAIGIAICNFSSAQSLSANAGNDQSICINDTSAIGGIPAATGGTPPYTYDWQPTTNLDFPTASNPNAFPLTPTNYTLTVTDGVGNSVKDIVSISLLPLPSVDAGPDQTIIGGTNTNLPASGAINYYWYPNADLSNANTATPTAEPGTTTIYCVAGADLNGCVNYDCMVLEVIPSDTVIIYNAFTPNGDGYNDLLFIGNLGKFPDNKLEVFNRN